MPKNPNRKFIPEFRLREGKIRGKNFAGKATDYTPAGERTFLLVLSEDQGALLTDQGWNVKRFKPKPDGELGDPFLKVKVSYDKGYPPAVWAVYPKVKRELNAETVSLLDGETIKYVDVVITPYQWTYGVGKDARSGVSAYLQKMYAIIEEDELDELYRSVPDSIREDPLADLDIDD